MRKLTGCTPLLLGIALLLTPSVAPARRTEGTATADAVRRPSLCRVPAHHTVLVYTSRLVVWLVVRNPPPFGDELTETYFACAPPHGRTRVVATAGSFAQCASSVTFKTAGSLLLTREFGGCSVGWSETLILHDLRHERTTEIIAYSGENFGSTQVPSSLQPLGAPFGLKRCWATTTRPRARRSAATTWPS